MPNKPEHNPHAETRPSGRLYQPITATTSGPVFSHRYRDCQLTTGFSQKSSASQFYLVVTPTGRRIDV
jgi:hypothetical protein